MDYKALLPTAEDSARPTWARSDWPPAPTDELTRALDAGDMVVVAPVKAATAQAIAVPAAVDSEAITRAAQDSISAMMLIRTYRVRGHLAANLDPLGLMKRDLPVDMTPEYHGFHETDLDRPAHIGGALGLQTATIR